MSHKNHHSSGIVHDIQVLSNEQLAEQYDIEIDDDGTVWDPVEGKTFNSLHEWAAYVEENDADAYDHYEKIGHKHSFDDGY